MVCHTREVLPSGAVVVYSVYYGTVLYGIDAYFVAGGELGGIAVLGGTGGGILAGGGLLACGGSITAIGYLDGEGGAVGVTVSVVAGQFAFTASGQQKGRGKHDDRSKQHGG